MSVYTYRIF